jgi:hypothetical protein
VGMSTRTFHYLRPKLPAAVVIPGTKCVRWRVAELREWVAALDRVERANPEPPQLAAGKAKKRAERLAAGGGEGESRPTPPQSKARSARRQITDQSNSKDTDAGPMATRKG